MNLLLFLLSSLVAQAASPQAASAQPSIAPAVSVPSATPSAPAAPATRPQESNVIAIPSTWKVANVKQSSDVFRRIGAWTDGSGNGEALTVDVAPSFGFDLKRFQASTSAQIKRDASVTMLSSGPLQLCGGRSGWKQTYRDSSGEGMTFIFTLTRARAYVAAYTYPAYPGASTTGEAAAESLCPPPDPAVRLPPPPLAAPAQWIAQDPSAYYAPRPGWTEWLWQAPVKERVPQRLVVMEFPMPPNAAVSYSFTAWISRFSQGHATVLKRLPAELCHRSTDGVYVAMRVTDSKSTPLMLESVMTVVAHRAYVAVYSRAAGEPARREAYQSLASLCPASAK